MGHIIKHKMGNHVVYSGTEVGETRITSLVDSVIHNGEEKGGGQDCRAWGIMKYIVGLKWERLELHH